MPVTTTTALLVSAGVSAAGTGLSFAQAGKQRKAADKAREAAQRAVEEAKAQMGVNYLEALSLPMEAYEAQREAVGQQAADILAEATQGEQRGVGAAAGRIMAARTEAERQLNAEIAQQQFTLDQAKRAEDARLAGARASISLAETEGAQLAAREAEAARARAITQGVQGIGDLAKLGMQAAPLYGKTAAPGTPKNMSPVNLEQPLSAGSPVVAAPQAVSPQPLPRTNPLGLSLFDYYQQSVFNTGNPTTAFSGGQYAPIFSSVEMPK